MKYKLPLFFLCSMDCSCWFFKFANKLSVEKYLYTTTFHGNYSHLYVAGDLRQIISLSSFSNSNPSSPSAWNSVPSTCDYYSPKEGEKKQPIHIFKERTFCSLRNQKVSIIAYRLRLSSKFCFVKIMAIFVFVISSHMSLLSNPILFFSHYLVDLIKE